MGREHITLYNFEIYTLMIIQPF